MQHNERPTKLNKKKRILSIDDTFAAARDAQIKDALLKNETSKQNVQTYLQQCFIADI
jgi:hypothetical protein